jgi:REP-associated tyrosine transposase
MRLNRCVNEHSKTRRPGPPHNPALRDLIKGKQQWSSPPQLENLRKGFRGWYERGYLPHRDEPGLVQFVTYRLTDSFPESLRSEWEHLLKIEDDREQRKQLESYLDKGRGDCFLLRPQIAQLVEENFRQFSGNRYELRAWVVMPNHVHVLFKVETVSMSEIVGGWKRHTGRLANKLLGREGAFWSGDYFDTFMRDAEHERRAIRYIENNPTKARLVLGPKEWPRSSARFRDAYGVLRL